MDLTPKQKAFADHYLISFNGTDAALKAGYSKKSARAIAAENLTKPYIQDYIQQRVQKIEKNRIMSGNEVLELLSNIARGKIKEVGMDRVGNIVEAPAAIRDRIKAAELVGKSQKLFIDRIESEAITDVNVKIEVID